MIEWSKHWIGRFTDQIGTLEVLRADMKAGYITGFVISRSYDWGYNAWTENRPTPADTEAKP